MTQSIRHTINLVRTLFEYDSPNQGTQGMLSARTLASMLPDVTNVQLFGSALIKIEQGQAGQLLLSEIRELAHAFVSLVQLPKQAKMNVIQKMLPVQQTPVAANPPQQQTPVQSPPATGQQLQ